MNRILNLTTMVLSLAIIPLASGTVEEWSGRTLGVDYTITNNINVTIWANGIFKFQAEDGSGNLDVIGSITVADGVTGEVIVYIERDTDNDSPGATNVGAINLTNNQGANLTGNLAELRITGDLATDGNVVCDNVTGAISIGGSLDVYSGAGYNLIADSVDADVTFTEEIWGNIEFGSFAAGHTLSTGNATGSYTSGNITIGGNCAGTIAINDAYEGVLTVGGDLTGALDINGFFDRGTNRDRR